MLCFKLIATTADKENKAYYGGLNGTTVLAPKNRTKDVVSSGGGLLLWKAKKSSSCSPPKKQKQKKRRKAMPVNGCITNGAAIGADKTAVDADDQTPEGLELIPITSRLSALLFPTGGSDATYRIQIKSFSEHFRRAYADSYKIFNVSQKRSDLGRANAGAVVELGWPDLLAPPLDRLCSICKQLEAFLGASPGNLVVLHCKGHRARAAIVVAAYLQYTTICGVGEDSSSPSPTEDRFSMQLFSEKYLTVDGFPSHRRYLGYFIDLLSGSVRVYQAPIHLTQIHLSVGLCPGKTVLLKIYERMKLVWTSEKIALKDGFGGVKVVELAHSGSSRAALPLRGDVLFKCFDLNGNGAQNGKKSEVKGAAEQNQQKQLLFQCQFNTCALNLDSETASEVVKLELPRDQIDFIDISSPQRDYAEVSSLSFHFSLVEPIAVPYSTPGREEKQQHPTNSAAHLMKERSASPSGGKFAAIGSTTNLLTDISRVDSYENFERPEDDRSSSLPIGNSTLPSNNTSSSANATQKSAETNNGSSAVVKPLEPPSEKTDGADSGIGSDSPKTASARGTNSSATESSEQKEQIEKLGTKKMPPQVPPKPAGGIAGRRGSLTNYDNDEELEPGDPRRTSLEDCTIGRDRSVLPPGVRPRKHPTAAAHLSGGEGTGSGSDSDRPPLPAPSTGHPIEPDLVMKGRYDPNSRCFSYVPAKSLKEHYRAPKKPPPARRTSVVEPIDLDQLVQSPPADVMASSLQNLQNNSFHGAELKRREETPKWDAEIDKVAGPMEIPTSRRRASTSAARQFPRPSDMARSTGPNRPGDDYFRRRISPPAQQQMNSQFLPGSYRLGPPPESRATDSYESRIQHVHNDRTKVAGGQLDGEELRPLSVLQAQRATRIPARRLSPARRSASSPSRKRSEMDDLLDPEFYMHYSPTVPRAPAQLQKVATEPIQTKPHRLPSSGTYFSYGGGGGGQSAPARQVIPSPTVAASQRYIPPQNQQQQIEDYRRRNCRSMNSTPTWRDRKVYASPYEHYEPSAADGEEEADDWLNAKLRLLATKRFFEPDPRKRHDTEQMLLEELKQVGSGRSPQQQRQQPLALFRGPSAPQQREEDPLEEYRREEQRLRNTRSPFIDELRIANRKLQRAINEGTYRPNYIDRARQQQQQQQEQPQRPYHQQHQRSISVAPDNRGWQASAVPLPGLASTPITATAESPMSGGYRRATAPGSQLMSAKPPTPPPSSAGRDRSRSPAIQQLMAKQRALSKSVPPPQAPESAREAEELRSTAVSPTVYAMRQSLYAKERERLGIPERGYGRPSEFGANREEGRSGTNRTPYDFDQGAIPYREEEFERNPNRNPQNPHYFGGDSADHSRYRNDSPVKPILKRPANNGYGGSTSNRPTAHHQQEDYPTQSGVGLLPNRQTPGIEESNQWRPYEYQQQRRKEEPNYQQQRQPLQQQPQPLQQEPVVLGERSDTPQFPLETPVPFHPLLYKDAAQKSHTYPAQRFVSGTPHSMLGTSRRSSMASVVLQIPTSNRVNGNGDEDAIEGVGGAAEPDEDDEEERPMSSASEPALSRAAAYSPVVPGETLSPVDESPEEREAEMGEEERRKGTSTSSAEQQKLSSSASPKTGVLVISGVLRGGHLVIGNLAASTTSNAKPIAGKENIPIVERSEEDLIKSNDILVPSTSAEMELSSEVKPQLVLNTEISHVQLSTTDSDTVVHHNIVAINSAKVRAVLPEPVEPPDSGMSEASSKSGQAEVQLPESAIVLQQQEKPLEKDKQPIDKEEKEERKFLPKDADVENEGAKLMADEMTKALLSEILSQPSYFAVLEEQKKAIKVFAARPKTPPKAVEPEASSSAVPERVNILPEPAESTASPINKESGEKERTEKAVPPPESTDALINRLDSEVAAMYSEIIKLQDIPPSPITSPHKKIERQQDSSEYATIGAGVSQISEYASVGEEEPKKATAPPPPQTPRTLFFQQQQQLREELTKSDSSRGAALYRQQKVNMEETPSPPIQQQEQPQRTTAKMVSDDGTIVEIETRPLASSSQSQPQHQKTPRTVPSTQQQPQKTPPKVQKMASLDYDNNEVEAEEGKQPKLPPQQQPPTKQQQEHPITPVVVVRERSNQQQQQNALNQRTIQSQRERPLPLVGPSSPSSPLLPSPEARESGGKGASPTTTDAGVYEEWRGLSPRTLSRINNLKVVMERENGKDGMDIIHHHPVFVKDTSKYWYKPKISRDEAISMLKSKPPGTFVIRDSNSFPGAFGLALKVAMAPPGVTVVGDGTELVRHFLIEPSNKGVRLKGCPDEPVFGTLAALVYQHSITPLALPCKLIMPEYDPATTPEHVNSNQALLERGAACNVTYLGSLETESLTGPEALKRSTSFCFELFRRRELRPVPVHFKVSSQGITLTDNTRTLFFRRHYPVSVVIYAGVDPQGRVFDNSNMTILPPTYVRQAPIFGFVARKFGAGVNGTTENVCHVFAEMDPDQPATAIVRFIANVMMPLAAAANNGGPKYPPQYLQQQQPPFQNRTNL